MSLRMRFIALILPLGLIAALTPVSAQLPPVTPAPLEKRAPAGQSGCSASSPTSCDEVAPKIIANALGPSPLEENLRQLTDRVGGRVTGSPAMERGVAWGLEAFRRSGVDDVHTEKYTIPVTWSEGATRLDVLASVAFPVHLVSIGWSPATPAAGIEADLVDVGEGTEADFARAGTAAKGAILLIHSGPLRTWDDLFNEYLRSPATIDRAVQSGAAALLWMSTREHGLLYRHQNSLTGELDRLPQAIVAREDAERLARIVAAGEKVRVRLSMPNRIGGPAEQQNVVAEIRGREMPDEFVILGAHLDSWELGTGALDNGCNAALVVEAARAIAASGVKPRRSLRFILFSGEEQGMLGSWAYARAHRAELDRAIAVAVFDEGIGRVSGYSLGGRRDIEAGLRDVLKPVESWGISQHTYDAPVGTDNFDFLLEGVPTLIANQEEANYLINYHASSDTLDKVDLRELKLHAALAAVTVYGIAERAERLGKRQSRAEIEALMKETGLDQQMRGFGVWPLWESGRRGRQP
jgi:carboxypeptidase Q